MFTHDPADDGRYTYLRMQIASPDAIERVIDLDDPETVARLAAVYDRAEELLQQPIRRESSRGRQGKPQDGGQSGEART